MKYRVTHITVYEYPAPVTVSHHTARLHPRQDGRQQCRGFSLQITPHPALRTARNDFFGNQISAFSIQEIHDRLEINVGNFGRGPIASHVGIIISGPKRPLFS